MKKFTILVLLITLRTGFTQQDSWHQWGGNPARNNVATGLSQLPLNWHVQYKGRSWQIDPEKSDNIVWAAPVHAHGYRGMNTAPPAVANGKIFVCSNNEAGYIAEDKDLDLAVLLCLNESDGSFLWQHGNKRLPTGKVNDWEYGAPGSTPTIEGNRLWYVNNRCEVVCLDTEGFHDDRNDGITSEPRTNLTDADVIWTYDMRTELGVYPHNFTSSSVVVLGDRLFLNTGNGVTYDHRTLPSPGSPSFICLNKHTGELIWENNDPGGNIYHGSWSSPACGIIDGKPQIIFAGGDGWLYSYDPSGTQLWKFDCNPKTAAWPIGYPPKAGPQKNNLIGFPVIHGGRVYVATGQEPEHGVGPGRLLCIDPRRQGDVSKELVYNRAAPSTVIPPKRYQTCDPDAGDFTRPNPNSALLWSDDQLNRTCGTPAISGGLLIIGDANGDVHCFDAKTGQRYWQHRTHSRIWGAPLIASDHIYIGTEDGEVFIFELSVEQRAAKPIRIIEHSAPVYAPPIAVGEHLYVLTSRELMKVELGE